MWTPQNGFFRKPIFLKTYTCARSLKRWRFFCTQSWLFKNLGDNREKKLFEQKICKSEKKKLAFCYKIVRKSVRLTEHAKAVYKLFFILSPPRPILRCPETRFISHENANFLFSVFRVVQGEAKPPKIMGCCRANFAFFHARKTGTFR